MAYYAGGLEAPAGIAEEVEPDDDAVFTNTSRSLYVGVTGNVKVTTVNGDVATFVAVPAGMILPIRVTKVWENGTTAESIVSLL